MHAPGNSESTASGHWQAQLEALPAAAAIFSSDGTLRLANHRFRAAAGSSEAGSARQLAETLRSRLANEPAQPMIEVRVGSTSLTARVLQIEAGQLLVWLEPETDDARERRSSFLSVASHDLRGSIANARSYASLLLSPRLELNERARHCAEVIQRNADRALRLVAECFDLFFYELHALDLDFSVEDLSAVFAEVVDQATALASARGVTLVAQLPEHLPSMSVDRGRLVQASLAFAAHSIARAGKGEPVRFEARVRQDSIIVEISDQAELKGEAVLYDAVSRAISEGKLGEGFRLGLARATIEAHGGEVGARSSAVSGSTFCFALPLKWEPALAH